MMSGKEIKEIVKEAALHLYKTEGIKLVCEECYYLTDPECPSYPHVCALEEALKNPEAREWVLTHMADRLEMRREWRKRNVYSVNRQGKW